MGDESPVPSTKIKRKLMKNKHKRKEKGGAIYVEN
jgi:hypothetical protein